MPQNSPTEPTARELRVEDLRRRIEELEALDESVFGRFTALDWLLCVVGAVVAPLLALWWASG